MKLLIVRRVANYFVMLIDYSHCNHVYNTNIALVTVCSFSRETSSPVQCISTHVHFR